LILSVKFP